MNYRLKTIKQDLNSSHAHRARSSSLPHQRMSAMLHSMADTMKRGVRTHRSVTPTESPNGPKKSSNTSNKQKSSKYSRCFFTILG